MTIFSGYARLSVSVKLLSLPLIFFLGLWTAGTLAFAYFAKNRLEQTAYQETVDLALLLQQDLKQKQDLLRLKNRWISEEKTVVEAVAVRDHALLLRTLLPIQAALELDLVKLVDPKGQSLLSSQQRSLEQVVFQDATINATAQTGLELSGTLSAESTASSSLVSFISIKSSTQILATLVVGVAVDEAFLQKIRGNTSMQLVAFHDDRIIASTLPLNPKQPWQVPPSEATPTRIELAGKSYLVKTIEVADFNQTTLKISVLNSLEETEQAKQQIWLVVGSFGLLGGLLVIGVMAVGLRITQTLSRRIQNLTQATQQLAQGDLSIRIPINTQDEVGVLAQGFNTMADQLTTRDQLLSQQMQQLQNTLEELHRTQGQMVQSEKMSALGQMVAGVAHEINNPVNFIHGNLSHIEQYTQTLLQLVDSYQHHYPHPPQPLQAELEDAELDFLTEDLTKVLQSMKVGSDRIRNIVISLRNFSRIDESEFKSADLHEGIDNTLMILQYRLKAKPDSPAIEIVKNYGPLPLVECYPGHLNQVFMNLLTNAIDALDELTQHKTSDRESTQPGQIWISTQLTDDDQVQVTIEDNGPGISQAIQARIFDPFFTTKPIGKGTGLGLSISYQIIVVKHHGRMWCKSTPGKGTKFEIFIPICQPK